MKESIKTAWLSCATPLEGQRHHEALIAVVGGLIDGRAEIRDFLAAAVEQELCGDIAALERIAVHAGREETHQRAIAAGDQLGDRVLERRPCNAELLRQDLPVRQLVAVVHRFDELLQALAGVLILVAVSLHFVTSHIVSRCACL